ARRARQDHLPLEPHPHRAQRRLHVGRHHRAGPARRLRTDRGNLRAARARAGRRGGSRRPATFPPRAGDSRRRDRSLTCAPTAEAARARQCRGGGASIARRRGSHRRRSRRRRSAQPGVRRRGSVRGGRRPLPRREGGRHRGRGAGAQRARAHLSRSHAGRARMSLQTHTPPLAPPQGPLSPFRRALFALRRAAREPNPVWIRELKQSARLPRTPVILAVVTGMVTLLIASIGGVLSVTAEPAQVGAGVFHTFFSLAFAIVTTVGPAVAATTIASEKSGRTWEALLLTGLSPAAIARGKFLAAFTYVSLYVVMLAPVGALAFLFGGVTPAEVLLAFAVLLLIASLSVAFGLAVSSKLSTPAASILVTLFVGLPLAMVVYGLGGVALSFAVHELWPAVTGGAPVWLPTAYVR